MWLKCSEQSRWVFHVEAGYRDVLGNNGACADNDMIADSDRKDSRIGSNTHVIAKLGWPPKLWLSGRTTTNKKIIDEHGAVRNEAIVPDRNQCTEERVRLNPAPLTDSY